MDRLIMREDAFDIKLETWNLTDHYHSSILLDRPCVLAVSSFGITDTGVALYTRSLYMEQDVLEYYALRLSIQLASGQTLERRWEDE